MPKAVRSVALNVVARDAPWCPGSSAPSYLDGSLPGRQAELLNQRAMVCWSGVAVAFTSYVTWIQCWNRTLLQLGSRIV
eukprot:7174714-Pyramimonas_sp.AAC.1